MASLGRVGTDRPAPTDDDVDTLEYFDVTVRTNPAHSDLDLIDFMESAGNIDTANPRHNIAAVAAVKRLLRSLIHPDDFDLFWQTAREHGQQLEDLMGDVWALIEAITDRPTGQRSASTGGPLPTPETSESPPASLLDQLRPKLQKHHPGRPDLQVAALRTVEARIAAAS
ncbi:MAG: hypothetical protein LC798_10840 [Chloroflexi bacterium]|nr:hypothetical protein [Chloroflexota bacterium]